MGRRCLQVSAVSPRIVVGQGFTTRRYTVDSSLRYVGGAVGFGFGAMWMTEGIGAAIACLLLAALGCGVVLMAERAQANASAQRPSADTFDADADYPLTADEFELEELSYEQASNDEGSNEQASSDEPAEEARSPLAVEAEYGWPVG
jgi:predicted lipid-binding transport protein (Tim44 family)